MEIQQAHCDAVFFLDKLVPLPRDKNCTAVWEAFHVVLEKDPCSVFPSDYDLFINLSRHSIPRDKVRPFQTWLSVQTCEVSSLPRPYSVTETLGHKLPNHLHLWSLVVGRWLYLHQRS